jgi:pyridoxal phosphate enzyme (YggS family)
LKEIQMGSIAENIKIIEERILKACQRSCRKRGDITLMAVTKFMPIEAVIEAWDAGIRCFGESRVQEAVSKFASFRTEQPGAELHLIGALQRNKAKTAAAFFDCIQSLDRESLAEELAKHATQGRSEALPVLLELRTGEDSKSGFESLDSLFRAAELILACPTLRIRGLMTLAPNTGEEAPVRAAFRKLAKTQQELETRFPNKAGHSFSCLSMGMSGDFETAIEEGSTMLRIGSAIFGDRI